MPFLESGPDVNRACIKQVPAQELDEQHGAKAKNMNLLMQSLKVCFGFILRKERDKLKHGGQMSITDA